MCWTQYWEKPTLKQAEKDITVYKILLKTKNPYKTLSFKGLYYYILSLLKIIKKVYYISPIMNKHYTLNKRNKDIVLKIKECDKNDVLINEFYINEGYHSYIYADTELLIPIIKNIKKHTLKPTVLMECIIPKGSYYCKNFRKEVVSSNIIIKKEIKVND